MKTVDALRYKSSFSEDCQKYREVERGTPEPMARIVTPWLFQVSPKQNDGETEGDLQKINKIINRSIEGRCAYDAMVKRIANPQPERGFRKERVRLPQHIQLGISVKDARWDELIEDADDKRGEEREQDIIKWQSPWFIGDLAGEVIEERKLGGYKNRRDDDDLWYRLTQNCVIYRTMFL